MTKYESLLDSAKNEDLFVEETPLFSGTRIKGLYYDKHIAINKDLETDSDKACILAEELGHHYTTVGNILDQGKTENRKQELKARAWAYDKLIGLRGIINAHNSKCQSVAEMADYLCVTEDFIVDAIQYYKSKYGVYAKIDNYIIFFEPSLGVFEIYKQ